MRPGSSSSGADAAQAIAAVFCVIGSAGIAFTILVSQPDTPARTAFRWLLFAACIGFLAVGVVLLLLVRAKPHPPSGGRPAWLRPAVIVGGSLICAGLLGMLVVFVAHPALWVAVAAVGFIMGGIQVLGLAAGVYRIHGGRPVG